MRGRIVAIHKQRDEGHKRHCGKGRRQIIRDHRDGEHQLILSDPVKDTEQDVRCRHGNARNQQRAHHPGLQGKEPANQGEDHCRDPAKPLGIDGDI